MKLRLSWLATLSWAGLTLAGVLLAGALHFPGDYGSPQFSLAAFDGGAALLGFVFGAVSGLIIAGLQSFVLRAWGGPTRAWLGYNALGFGLVHALADGFASRSLVFVAGGLLVAACQYLALRRALAPAAWWLPLAAGAWWLAFGLSAGGVSYNPLVVGLVLGGASALGLRSLLQPTAPPPARRQWAQLSRPQKLRLVALIVGMMFVVAIFAVQTFGLLGMLRP